jgi:hypothetical protein
MRAAYVEQKAKDITERTGMSILTAKRIIERQFRGILLPDIVLPFDDEEFAGCTVADVPAEPDRFEGATLADPNEGPDYGFCVAKILRRPDGALWIHSFAHGRTVYELKYDAAAVRSAIEKADKAEMVKTLLDLAVGADLDVLELFLKQEDEEDEDSISLVDALTVMAQTWGQGFTQLMLQS